MIDAIFRLPRPTRGLSAAERYTANIEAIRVVRSLDGRVATDDERRALALYSGWGDTDVRKRGMDYNGIPINELADLRLEQHERRGIAKSTMNAHYTSWEVINAIWGIATHLGFRDLVDPWVLEPSCGVAHFFGVMPDLATVDPAHLFGVEIDPVSARIAAALYPTCRIDCAPFERAALPDGAFDLVVGNVPFGNYPVDDERLPQRLRRTIHDYFVCRSIALLRPGGVAILITSKGTLDKDADDVRRWIADRADLLGAMRLPSTAFEECAGTSVTTDVLVLRRLDRDAPGREVDWLKTASVSYPDDRYDFSRTAQVNAYFHAHPTMVLGQWCHNRLAYGRDDGAAVKPRDGDAPLAELMREATLRLPAGALQPRAAPVVAKAPAEAPAAPPPVDLAPLRTPAFAAAERLAGVLRRLLRAQVDAPEEEVDALRRRLGVEYDALRRRHGALRAAEAHPRHPLHGATRESWWALVSALEDARGEKAAVFRERTVARVEARTTTDPTDALYLTLDELGHVDLDAVAQRCGRPAQEVRDALRDVVFLDGPGGEWLTASQYLSGHVREKLRRAVEWAAVDEAFAPNVRALETAQPDPVPPDEVVVGLGAGWVPAATYDAFLRHLFPRYDGHGVRLHYVEATASWLLEVTSRQVRESVENTSTYGTTYFDGVEILQHALTLRVPVATDEVDTAQGPRRVRNDRETLLAQAKLSDVRERWANWIMADEARARELAGIYNERFNGFRRRAYDGAHLRFPGLSTTLEGKPLTLRRHQVNGALRIVDRGDVDDSALLTYDVGWGKTIAILLGVVKRLQLGLSRKACLVVPRHVIGQWADAFRAIFPGHADWLLAATDGAFDDRRRFLARAATTDARIVLLTYEQFRTIPVEPDLFAAYMRREVVDLEDALADVAGGTEEARHLERTLKRRQAALERFDVKQRQRWHKVAGGSDAPVAWRSLGFDLLGFDEAHYLKNDSVNSRMEVAGMPRAESLRALDARVKAHWLIAPELFPGVAAPAREGKVVGATATPLTNTLAEMWVMLRLFQPRLLRRLGFWHFDAWAATFTTQWQSVEMDSVGKFTTRTRLKFQNVPEILDALALCWDSAPGCDDMVRPDVVGGKMEVVKTEGSDALRDFTASLARRADAIRGGSVKSDEDNMLLITHEGRCASLFNGPPPAKGATIVWPIDRRTKIDAVADYVWDLYCRTDEADGVILVFCDLYTPKTESDAARAWDDESGSGPPVVLTAEERWLEHGVYGVIVDKCRERGVLRDEVAYIHDAATDSDRRALFARVNRGEVRVLIGSTQKLGTGVNVHRRAIAALHVTVPWRPDWLRQATGRVRRPGNLWSEIHEVAFPTTTSYDVVLWQMIQQKAEMIAAISDGTYALRSADDVGDMVLSASVAKAIALGDVRVLDKVRMESELAVLQRSHRTWRTDRARHEWEIRRIPDDVATMDREADELAEAVSCRDRHPLRDGAFLAKLRMVMSEDWQAVADRAVADRRLQVITESLWHKGGARVGSAVLIGSYRGFTLTLEFEAGGASLVARPGDDGAEIEIEHREFGQAFAVLERRLADLEAQVYRLRANARIKRQRLEDLQRAAPAWREGDRARDLHARYTSLCADLAQGGIVDAQTYCFD